MWVTMPVWIEILCEVCIGGHCFIESISFLGKGQTEYDWKMIS